MNDNDTALLLRSLDCEPATPSTVDIERAVRDGRRQARRRRATQAGSVVVAVALVIAGGAAAVALRTSGQDTDTAVPDIVSSASGGSGAASASASVPVQAPAPPAPTRCALSLLPIPDGVRMALVSGADPTGRLLVGRSYLGHGGHQVLLWRDGQAHKVPLDGADPSLDDINTAGVAVGTTFRSRPGGGEEDSRQVAVAYLTNGSVVELPGAPDAAAHAINETGTIVGESARRPVRWVSPQSAAEELPLPSGASAGAAHDVDEDGTIVGHITLDGRDDRPYVWFPDGTHRPLPLPLPAGDGAQTNANRQFIRAYGIRNGWVTGISGMADARAVRWNLRTGEVKLFPEFLIRASMANAHGWQVGTDQQGRAILVSPAGTVVLPDLSRHEPGNLRNIATTVSDDGRTIGGQSDDSNDVIRAVVWRCS